MTAVPDAGRGGYRPDIDGLRAVAIALVVAFHFGVPGLAGGYLGVDLFFVISGFLIASIFARGEIVSIATLATFYGRRVKRLMPAFVVVALATIAAGTVLLLPDDYEALLDSVRASLAFSANRHFARVTTDYFASGAAQSPWLHAWSLSVEWQFYFVFPFVWLAIESLRAPSARRIAWVVLLVAAIVASIALVERLAAEAYFSAPARFFEFVLGALATRVPSASPTGSTARWWSMGGIAGVALLVVCALTFDATTPFPGANALWVCLIGFGLIVVGPRASPLSHPALAWIGKRSYSIYLWHWPVVAFSTYLQREPSVVERLAWVAGVVLLADATWRLVERPGQRLAWRPLATILVGCVLPLVCVAAFAFVVHRLDGLPGRLGPEASHAHANLLRYASHRADRCHDAEEVDVARCTFGDLGASTEALLVGDSHARHFRPFVDVLATHAHVKVLGLTNSECATLEGSADRVAPRWRAACAAATARDFALIRSGRFRFVILAERWIGYPPEALAGLDRSIAAIVAAGAIPIVFKPIAENGTNTKDCFYRHVKLRTALIERCAIAADNPYAASSRQAFDALLRDVARRHPTLVVIDPQAVQCVDGTCATVIDGTPIYSDLHHLEPFGATMLGRAWLARFGDPFASH